MVAEVEILYKHAAATTGEGPHWEENSGKLLFVDIHKHTVNRFHVETKVNEQIELAADASLIVPSRDGGYIVSSQRKLCHLDWDTKEVKDLFEVPEVGQKDRFNDGKCDHQGRLWAGTMGFETAPAVPELGAGRLFMMEKGNLSVADDTPFDISNGLAWSADDTVMYFVDSIPRHVYAYDFDPSNGAIANRRVAIDFSKWSLEETGYPDGMCIDQEGKLWIAGFASSKVMQFDPVTGQKLSEVKLPAKQVTSCCFGGKDYADMFVTSSAAGYSPEEMAKVDPLNGSIFRVTGLGSKGLPADSYCP
ncbi:regucalcin-like [Watersipora subatra]|uniref:regucalcin-like n=1 Tax=Watersipora subatra TaxID=2589382 RepID=UPI00355C87A9